MLASLADGVGKEVLFQGVVQAWIVQQAMGISAISPEMATLSGVVVTSVTISTARPANSLGKFTMSVVGGMFFGIAYLNCGLSTAAFLHAIDIFCFISWLNVSFRNGN